jgi:hypothetical protein
MNTRKIVVIDENALTLSIVEVYVREMGVHISKSDGTMYSIDRQKSKTLGGAIYKRYGEAPLDSAWALHRFLEELKERFPFEDPNAEISGADLVDFMTRQYDVLVISSELLSKQKPAASDVLSMLHEAESALLSAQIQFEQLYSEYEGDESFVRAYDEVNRVLAKIKE